MKKETIIEVSFDSERGEGCKKYSHANELYISVKWGGKSATLKEYADYCMSKCETERLVELLGNASGAINSALESAQWEHYNGDFINPEQDIAWRFLSLKFDDTPVILDAMRLDADARKNV